MNADDYLDNPHAEDIALDYVEHELGRLHFRENWEKLENKEEEIASWLRDVKEDPTLASSIVRAIDSLYQDGTTWEA